MRRTSENISTYRYESQYGVWRHGEVSPWSTKGNASFWWVFTVFGRWWEIPVGQERCEHMGVCVITRLCLSSVRSIKLPETSRNDNLRLLISGTPGIAYNRRSGTDVRKLGVVGAWINRKWNAEGCYCETKFIWRWQTCDLGHMVVQLTSGVLYIQRSYRKSSGEVVNTCVADWIRLRLVV